MKKAMVIAYTGREGSSAIVSSLKRHPAINVPVFEHMDYRNARNYGADAHNVSVGVKKLINGAQFSEDIFSEKKGSERRERNDAVVAFKWRMWGDNENLVGQLRSEDVIFINLLRKDFLNLGLSNYLTRRVNNKVGHQHPQFEIRNMSEKEREKEIEEFRSAGFEVDPNLLLEDMQKYLTSKLKLQGRLSFLFRKGFPVYNAYYEDFLESKRCFMEKLLGHASLPFSDEVLKTAFVKVNNSDIRPQVKNLEEIECDSSILNILDEYQNVLDNDFH